MAGKKKFDLDEFNSDTSKTQAKHRKYSGYIEKVEEAVTAPVQIKEGEIVKRINMAFTDENYETVQGEANRLGINLAFFLNTLVRIVDESDIDSYIESQPIKRTKDNVARRKGNPAKRINLKFHEDTHQKLKDGAEKYNQTLTQYMNVIVEVYAQDKNN